MFKTLRSWTPESDGDDKADLDQNVDNTDWLALHRFDLKDEELMDCFPFTPYPSQMQFMRELYTCASRGRYLRRKRFIA